MKPTLFLLAAGMGSRYGGLKQLDGLGPNGETIMDYSIYDAINAGFGKLVFVIRKDFEQDFREKIISKYEGHIPCELVFQALDNLPEGFTCPAERTHDIQRTVNQRACSFCRLRTFGSQISDLSGHYGESFSCIARPGSFNSGI